MRIKCFILLSYIDLNYNCLNNNRKNVFGDYSCLWRSKMNDSHVIRSVMEKMVISIKET